MEAGKRASMTGVRHRFLFKILLLLELESPLDKSTLQFFYLVPANFPPIQFFKLDRIKIILRLTIFGIA